MRWRARVGVLATLLAATAATAASPATAATVEVGERGVIFRASEGERNLVAFGSSDDGILVEDAGGAVLLARDGCTPRGTSRAVCDTTGTPRCGAPCHLVETGDEDDRVVFRTGFGSQWELVLGLGDDRLDGGPDAVEANGGPGDDVLLGGESNDVFVGGSGADVVDGRGGGDAMRYADTDGPVRVHLDGRPGDGRPGEGDDVRVETVYGGPFDDVLRGGDGGDTLYGEDGRDSLIGAGGDDDLSGGGQEDMLDGGAGSDDLDADEGPARVRCGDGEDRAFASGRARAEEDCEVVGLAGPLPAVRLLPTRRSRRALRVRVEVEDFGAAVRGTVSVRARIRARRVLLGRARLRDTAAGEQRTVVLRLSRTARRRLGTVPRARLRTTLDARTGAPFPGRALFRRTD